MTFLSIQTGLHVASCDVHAALPAWSAPTPADLIVRSLASLPPLLSPCSQLVSLDDVWFHSPNSQKADIVSRSEAQSRAGLAL